jgi:peptidylprolyl isomerase
MFKSPRLPLLLCLCVFGAPGCGGGEGPEAAEVPELAAPADVQSPPPDAERSASGLVSKRLVAGQGVRFPSATDRVRVHYAGWKSSGELFDTSLGGEPREFPLDRVIPGWTEGLQLMVEGEKRRFWIPEYLAYGGRREPLGGLVFDVELIAILGS